MKWIRVSPDDVGISWDAELLRFSDYNLFQSSRWGRYKLRRGWLPHCFMGESKGAVVAMLQALVRTYPFRTCVVWCPGGPVGALQVCTRELMGQLSSLLGARALYCRCSVLRPVTVQDDQYLQANGWRRPRSRVGVDMTAVWDLSQTTEQLRAGLNRNWRYSLKKAETSGLTVEHLVDPPIQELTDLCNAMSAAKGVSATTRSPDLEALFSALGEDAVVYGCRNDAGRLIAFHSCGIVGGRAWEMVAATSEEGRRNGASFVVLWSLIMHCRRLRVTHYDLAGLDSSRAPGVANFKRWTGAQDVEWLGEWEWSNSSLLQRAVEMTVRSRRDSAIP